MSPTATFLKNFPDLWRTTRHMAWPVKLKFWSVALTHYRKKDAERQDRANRPRVGNSELRATCCDLRTQEYPENQKISEISDLLPLVVPAGVAWGGYIEYFDCAVCGQAWVQDWEPYSHGGSYRVKKV